MADGLYIKMNERKHVDALHTLITNTLANANHPTTILAYEELCAWEQALGNPMTLSELMSMVEIERPSASKAVPATRKRKKKAEKEVKDSPFECSQHKTYGGVYAPRSDCARCWEIYKQLHRLEYDQKRRKFERIQGITNETKTSSASS